MKVELTSDANLFSWTNAPPASIPPGQGSLPSQPTQQSGSPPPPPPSSENLPTVQELLKLSEKNLFPQVTFKIDGKSVMRASTYNWFHSQRVFDANPTSNIEFKCILCPDALGQRTTRLKAPLGKTGNLNKHGFTHEQFRLWHDRYLAYVHKSNSFKRDERNMNLLKFILSSNVALEVMSNQYLRALLPFKPPSVKTLRQVYLPSALDMLRASIEGMLDTSLAVTLIVDIWTNTKMVDFLGLAAVIMNSKGMKESFVLGMTTMRGRHNAENVKLAIERVVNKFKFDKSKLTAVVTDEGSNLLRLFKSLDQKTASLYIELSNEKQVLEGTHKFRTNFNLARSPSNITYLLDFLSFNLNPGP